MKKFYETLSFVFWAIALLAVFGFAGGSDFANRYLDGNIDLSVYMTIPIAAVAALIAWRFQEAASRISRRARAKDQQDADREQRLLDYVDGKRTGF